MTQSAPKPKVTVIIPARDEELAIARAVRSASVLGPVWVVDSESTDETVAVSQAAGAQVVVQPWLGHAGQKNWALDNLPIDTEWLMFLDADERIPNELQLEIAQTVQNPSADSFFMPRRNVFMGRDLAHVWWYPDYQLRLFRRGSARYEDREVHEHMVTTGPTGYLKNPLIHESLKGVDEFLERHTRYAKAEARAMHDATEADRGSWLMKGRAGRRRALKIRVWYRVPQRPAIRYLWLYYIRRGFLDGKQGRIYAQLISAYESMIDAYRLELEQDSDGC